jgi:hypothetical protein
VSSSQIRCFWSWPFGHHWQPVPESEDAMSHTLRCSRCGKEKVESKITQDVWPAGGE